MPSTPMRFSVLTLASGFGAGYAPKMPGTVGSLVAIIPWYFLQFLSPIHYCLMVLGASLAGIWICNKAEEIWSTQDDKRIVWDEFCGLWIALYAVPLTWYWIACGFLLFRLFDILKPWPIGWLDQQVKGGLGVMLDDLVAGLIALLCLQALVIMI